jgi:hypothetical protein
MLTGASAFSALASASRASPSPLHVRKEKAAAGEHVPHGHDDRGRRKVLWAIGALVLVASALLVVARERDRDSAELAGRAVGALVFALLVATVVWAIVYVAHRRKRGLEFFSPELLLLAAGIAFVSAVFLPATRRAGATHEKLGNAVAECTDGAMDEYDANPRKDEFPLTRAQFRVISGRVCETYGERGWFGHHDPTRKEQIDVFRQAVSELKAEGKLPQSVELAAP